MVGGVGYGKAAEGDVGEGVEAVEEEEGVSGGGGVAVGTGDGCVSEYEGEYKRRGFEGNWLLTALLGLRCIPSRSKRSSGG